MCKERVSVRQCYGERVGSFIFQRLYVQTDVSKVSTFSAKFILIIS